MVKVWVADPTFDTVRPSPFLRVSIEGENTNPPAPCWIVAALLLVGPSVEGEGVGLDCVGPVTGVGVMGGRVGLVDEPELLPQAAPTRTSAPSRPTAIL